MQRWVWDLVATRRARSRDVEADDQLIIRLPASLLGVEATFQIEVELEQRSLPGLGHPNIAVSRSSRNAQLPLAWRITAVTNLLLIAMGLQFSSASLLMSQAALTRVRGSLQ